MTDEAAEDPFDDRESDAYIVDFEADDESGDLTIIVDRVEEA